MTTSVRETHTTLKQPQTPAAPLVPVVNLTGKVGHGVVTGPRGEAREDTEWDVYTVLHSALLICMFIYGSGTQRGAARVEA